MGKKKLRWTSQLSMEFNRCCVELLDMRVIEARKGLNERALKYLAERLDSLQLYEEKFADEQLQNRWNQLRELHDMYFYYQIDSIYSSDEKSTKRLRNKVKVFSLIDLISNNVYIYNFFNSVFLAFYETI
jgi:mRNA-degrading endonuclease YafQ of YafQ-DinJ toxin-antitoxin module